MSKSRKWRMKGIRRDLITYDFENGIKGYMHVPYTYAGNLLIGVQDTPLHSHIRNCVNICVYMLQYRGSRAFKSKIEFIYFPGDAAMVER